MGRKNVAFVELIYLHITLNKTKPSWETQGRLIEIVQMSKTYQTPKYKIRKGKHIGIKISDNPSPNFLTLPVLPSTLFMGKI